jgi:hypothetical protein
MLAGLLATGIIARTPYISLKVDDLRDDSQSLVQARIQITEIASESDTQYQDANDGRITLSYNISALSGSFPPDRGVRVVVGGSVPTGTQITNTPAPGALLAGIASADTHRQSVITFTGFNAGTYPLYIADQALNATFGITLIIGYGAQPSYVQYRAVNYGGVGSIFFMPGLHNTINESGAAFSITNVRSGFASISCNDVVYEPFNKPATGTYLGQQQFSITDLDSRTSSLYQTKVYDPVTRVTHTLFLSAGYKGYQGPSLKINYIDSEVGGADNGKVSITFNSNEALSINDIRFSLDTGTNTVVQTTTKGVPVVFTDLAGVYVVSNDLIVTDIAQNRTWNLRLHIGYDSGLSYITYNDNVLYRTGDTIFFTADQSSASAQTKLLYKDKVYKKGDTILLS